MKVVVDLCLVPLGGGLSLSPYIAECQRVLEEMSLKHELHAYGTNIEGEWDEVFASHTFHEIQMYYPMRVVRERRYKLLWNIAHPLPFPFPSVNSAPHRWRISSGRNRVNNRNSVEPSR